MQERLFQLVVLLERLITSYFIPLLACFELLIKFFINKLISIKSQDGERTVVTTAQFYKDRRDTQNPKLPIPGAFYKEVKEYKGKKFTKFLSRELILGDNLTKVGVKDNNKTKYVGMGFVDPWTLDRYYSSRFGLNSETNVLRENLGPLAVKETKCMGYEEYKMHERYFIKGPLITSER